MTILIEIPDTVARAIQNPAQGTTARIENGVGA